MTVEEIPLYQEATTVTPATTKLIVKRAEALLPEAVTLNNLMIAWLDGLPTVDPAVAGAPYLNAGVLTVSNG